MEKPSARKPVDRFKRFARQTRTDQRNAWQSGLERDGRGSSDGVLRSNGQGRAAGELFKVSLLDQGGPLRGPRALAAEGRRRSCLPPRSGSPRQLSAQNRKQSEGPHEATRPVRSRTPGRHHDAAHTGTTARRTRSSQAEPETALSVRQLKAPNTMRGAEEWPQCPGRSGVRARPAVRGEQQRDPLCTHTYQRRMAWRVTPPTPQCPWLHPTGPIQPAVPRNPAAPSTDRARRGGGTRGHESAHTSHHTTTAVRLRTGPDGLLHRHQRQPARQDTAHVNQAPRLFRPRRNASGWRGSTVAERCTRDGCSPQRGSIVAGFPGLRPQGPTELLYPAHTSAPPSITNSTVRQGRHLPREHDDNPGTIGTRVLNRDSPTGPPRLLPGSRGGPVFSCRYEPQSPRR